MSTQNPPTFVPSKVAKTDYPLIDNDPHFKRVVGYARPSDYAAGGTAAAAGPGILLALEKFSPSYVGKGGFAPAMRLCGGLGLVGGFLYFYTRSSLRFYGMAENQREMDMDMREMVAKGVAARQSRYSTLFMGAMPWFNFVNHSQHGVDTAKYYRQAERELEAERNGGSA
ncbi:hypothetical protein RB595_010585 [Gaeumannomyces hyphopodioides]